MLIRKEDVAMYFFTNNYLYEYGVMISGENSIVGFPERNINDGDKNTYWSSSASSPAITINMSENRNVDFIWLKASNITSFTVYYYTTSWTQLNGAVQNKGNNIYWFRANNAVSAKDWKIVFTTTDYIKLYEMFIMQLRLEQTQEIFLPSKVDVTYEDTIGVEHTLSNGQTVVYSGRRPYANISIEYQYTPKENRDSLYNIYSLPYLRSQFCIIPDEDYPENIYRCVWIDKTFPLIYSISYKGAGFSGTIRLKEC